MWKIEFTKEAVRDLSKLENSVLKRIFAKLDECRKNPFSFFHRLVGYDDFKLRVGDYRILALLTSDKKIVVEKVGHRRNVYKKFKK